MRKVIYRNSMSDLVYPRSLVSSCRCHSKAMSLGSICPCHSKAMSLFDPNTARQQSGGVLDKYTPQEIDAYLVKNKNFKKYLTVLNSFISSDPNNISKLERVLKSDPIILQVLKEGLERGLQVEVKKKSILDNMKQSIATMGITYVNQQANKYCDKFLNWIIGKLGSTGSVIKNFLNMGKSIAESAIQNQYGMSLCEFGVDKGLQTLGNATFMNEFEDWLGVELITTNEELKTMQYGTVPAEKQKIAQAVSAITAGISNISSGGLSPNTFLWLQNDPRFQTYKNISNIVLRRNLVKNVNKLIPKVTFTGKLDLEEKIEGSSENESQAFSGRNIGIGLLVVALGVGTWYAVTSD